MSLRIKFKIVTPERTVFEDTIDQATLPVMDGEVTILPNHEPYIATLRAGEMIVKKDGKETSLAVSGGFIELEKNKLTILADTAERAEDIDLERAEEARERAEELKLVAAIKKESARISVAMKHRTRYGIKIN